MSEPRLKSMPILTPGGFKRLAWAEWGPDAPVKTVLCVHGLTRNGRASAPGRHRDVVENWCAISAAQC